MVDEIKKPTVKQVEVKQRGKKPLCIIGTAGTCGDAPYDMKIDDDYVYDIWGCGTSMVFPQVKRIDVLFELHPKRYWGDMAVTDRLNSFKGHTIYMQDTNPDVAKSVPFPREAIKKKYMLPAMGDNLYVTNTITWMLLMALEEGYTDISLYGVHMGHQTEYAYQRASCSWVLGIIHGWILDGKPYKLTIPSQSALLKAEYEYGFDEPTKQLAYIESRIQGLKNGAEEARTNMTALKEALLRNEGAISEAQHYFNKTAGWD